MAPYENILRAGAAFSASFNPTAPWSTTPTSIVLHTPSVPPHGILSASAGFLESPGPFTRSVGNVPLGGATASIPHRTSVATVSATASSLSTLVPTTGPPQPVSSTAPTLNQTSIPPAAPVPDLSVTGDTLNMQFNSTDGRNCVKMYTEPHPPEITFCLEAAKNGTSPEATWCTVADQKSTCLVQKADLGTDGLSFPNWYAGISADTLAANSWNSSFLDQVPAYIMAINGHCQLLLPQDNRTTDAYLPPCSDMQVDATSN